jgi:hypothetical protein
MLLRGPRASSQPVPPGTPVLDLFDSQQGQLLVLGAPGAGKTTLIVELAQALTTRALTDTQARIPVVLNVAAWRSGQNLRDWLAPTLCDLLGPPGASLGSSLLATICCCSTASTRWPLLVASDKP